MNSLALAGRSILVVEDEPVIALALRMQLREAGAKVFGAGQLREALHMAEHPALSAAVIDLRLGTDDCSAVCRRLTKLGIPFMFYTGYRGDYMFEMWPDAPVVSKPANGEVIVKAVARLTH